MSILRELLGKATADGASDVHLKSGSLPVFRVSGKVNTQGKEDFTPEGMDS